MIKPYYETRTYARGNYSIGNICPNKVFRDCIDFSLVRLVIGLKKV